MGAERAEALVASAEAEAEAVRRAAVEVRAAAREEGRAEGLRAARAELAARLAELAEAQRRWLARAEVEALDLAVEMARRHRRPGAPRRPGGGAARARRRPCGRRGAGGRCACGSTRTAWRRSASASASLAEATAGAALELVADPALAPGDVVVETEAGQVDGRIASRLEAFRAALEQEAA